MYEQVLKPLKKLGGALCIALWLVTPVASAHPVPELHYHLAQQSLSLQQAVAKVQAQHGGDVVKAETVDVAGRTAYRIRIVKNGRVKEFLLDASSGEPIKR